MQRFGWIRSLREIRITLVCTDHGENNLIKKIAPNYQRSMQGLRRQTGSSQQHVHTLQIHTGVDGRRS